MQGFIWRRGLRCECGFIVVGDFTIIKLHLFRPVYVLIVYYYSTCNNNNNSAFILISVFLYPVFQIFILLLLIIITLF